MKKIRNICIIEGIIIIILIIVLIFSINNKNIKVEEEQKTLEEITIRKQVIDGLEFKEISHVYGKSIGSKITIKITNKTDGIYYLNGFDVIAKDENGEILDTMKVHVYNELEPNESFEYLLYSNKDIVTNEDYSIEFIPNKYKN